ncbi:MAG: hypothetical protein J0I68_18160 [Achromobacter sp.]|jgi:hypothetical protein|nr:MULTISPECIES: hypothetical protein [Achromobacter]MBN9640472.1 hypothetical protein [Achromobacter sp.]MCG2598378.1 hypothetical protein [Achromobacter sp.]MCG2603250.1 hypothetical protein [Achromobacter sp.]
MAPAASEIRILGGFLPLMLSFQWVLPDFSVLPPIAAAAVRGGEYLLSRA